MTSYLNEALIPDLDRDGATQAGKSMCKRMGICKGAQNLGSCPKASSRLPSLVKGWLHAGFRTKA